MNMRVTTLGGGWIPGAALGLAMTAACLAASSSLSLKGTWRFQLDREDVGLQQRWQDTRLSGKARLPGALPAQGIGDEVTVDTKWTGGVVDRSWFTAPEYEKYRQPGNVKVPFWLQPERYYAGAAWFQRDIRVPAGWERRRVTLFLERPHWETRVWVDGRAVGSNNALATPHEYDLGCLSPGEHRLTLRVDNRMIVDVGHDSHSVSDHTQGNWNGIVGRLELRARGAARIDAIEVHPRNDGTVRLSMALCNTALAPARGKARVSIRERATGQEAGAGEIAFDLPPAAAEGGDAPGGSAARVEAVVKLSTAPRLWSEFSPALYAAECALDCGGPRPDDAASTVFGFREISTRGTQFLLNGTPIFFRGTLECAIFPRTGHPPTEIEEWKRIIRVAKGHGLNHIRFHSWCPPEAAFVAADELGFYYHVECSSWANSTTSLGDGKPVDRWIYEEADRILRSYGNHPSFLLMLYGNEPGGPKHAAFLSRWVSHYRERDARRLYSSGAGWPQIPENQFHVSPDPRIQAWGGGLKSRINARPPETRTDYRDYIAARTAPVISHEIGQWCVYPNFDEIPKYRGYLKPRNFEIFRDRLASRQMSGLAKSFLLASGKLQTLCYKEDIESALRTPGMGGFQLLDLHDFPGQGTALVGVLDPFWESKGYVSAREYSRFCNSTVPLARLERRVFTTDEALEADLEAAHFGPSPIEDAVLEWKLMGDDGRKRASGQLEPTTVTVGNGAPLGRIRAALADVPAPARYKLVVGLRGTPFENDWDVWIYPPKVDTRVPAGILEVEELNAEALAALENGGRVLLSMPPRRVRNAPNDKVALGFSSIFWNTAWTRRQAPTTLGILCDPEHPALAAFPTDFHSNWQWWYLVSRAGAMILDDLPPAFEPVVQVVDDWVTAHKLALVFEARMARGRLLVCSIDLKDDLNPVARQMRHSLLHYMEGKAFKPTIELTAGQVRALSAPPSVFERRGLKAIRASSAEANFEPENAIDGNPATLWHTQWTGAKPGFPHELVLEFKEPIPMRGLALLPRQDGNRNGWIKRLAVYLSDDGASWGEPVVTATSAASAGKMEVPLLKPQSARFVRLVVLGSHGRETHASLAEIEILE